MDPDITTRIPVLGNVFNNMIMGIHNMVFGASPSSFKKDNFRSFISLKVTTTELAVN